MKKPKPRQRRSLAYVGGAITTQGGEESKSLAQALNVTPEQDDESSRLHIHGFHTYPARLHPLTASRLVAAFSKPGERVLDPFCGSGTTLVESMILNRQAIGVDLNPLAVRLARCKLRPRTKGELRELQEWALSCAAHADEMRRSRSGARRRLPPEDMKLFDPHVLLELDSLRSAIETVSDAAIHGDLQLVLSSILVKLSRKQGDTSKRLGERRIAPGFASRVFVQKTEELTRRLAEFHALLPKPSPGVPLIVQDDATELKQLPKQPLDAVVTSPPYAATYDYVAHHELRLRWLGLDTREFKQREMGARSRYQRIDPRQARQEWTRELSAFLTAVGRVLRRGGSLCLVMADSAIGREALRADEIVAEMAQANGYEAVACASQSRPHFHKETQDAFRSRPRAEHAILLRRI
ncbi:MAG: DNA methyltransferase [Gemmataceae bacterium]